MTWHLNPKRNSGIKNRLHIIDKPGKIVVFDNNVQIIKYSQTLRTDENPMRTPTPEEYVHALAVCVLCGTKYKYQLENLYHEQSCY